MTTEQQDWLDDHPIIARDMVRGQRPEHKNQRPFPQPGTWWMVFITALIFTSTFLWNLFAAESIEAIRTAWLGAGFILALLWVGYGFGSWSRR